VYIIASIIKTTQNKNGDGNSEKITKILVFSTYNNEGCVYIFVPHEGKRAQERME